MEEDKKTKKPRLGGSEDGKGDDDNLNDSESQPDPKRQDKTNTHDGERNLPVWAHTDCDMEYEGGKEDNDQESEDKDCERKDMEDENSAPTESDGSGSKKSTHGDDESGDDDDDVDEDGALTEHSVYLPNDENPKPTKNLGKKLPGRSKTKLAEWAKKSRHQDCQKGLMDKMKAHKGDEEWDVA